MPEYCQTYAILVSVRDCSSSISVYNKKEIDSAHFLHQFIYIQPSLKNYNNTRKKPLDRNYRKLAK